MVIPKYKGIRYDAVNYDDSKDEIIYFLGGKQATSLYVEDNKVEDVLKLFDTIYLLQYDRTIQHETTLLEFMNGIDDVVQITKGEYKYLHLYHTQIIE